MSDAAITLDDAYLEACREMNHSRVVSEGFEVRELGTMMVSVYYFATIDRDETRGPLDNRRTAVTHRLNVYVGRRRIMGGVLS